MKFVRLFEPGHIGELKIKNRIVQAPMGTTFAARDGSVTQRQLNYYKERARGGTGLIIVEYAYIDRKASQTTYSQLGIYDDSLIAGLSTLARVIKDNGATAGIQIVHAGSQRYFGEHPPVAPSRVSWDQSGKTVPAELTIEEIEEIIKAFGNAARIAQQSGFDMVEIHGAHGYLITEFLSPYANRRQDKYGGSQRDRMRFALEVLNSVRSNVSSDFPVGMRISGSEYMEGGITIDDSRELAQELEKEGVNVIHVSGGTRGTIGSPVPMLRPRAFHVPLAEQIKRVVNIPVIASGAISNPQLAEEILEKDQADFISLARPLLADPWWASKAEEGREKDITTCIRCNECMARGATIGRTLTCTVNTTAGFEEEFKIEPAAKSKKVAVIGGGPGGMEAARVAALRGHQVTLYEKRDQLGGYLIEASVPGFKKDLASLKDYLTMQVKQLGVNILLGTEATLQTLKEQGFDTIIVATGSTPMIPDIQGADKPIVLTAVDVMRKKPIGQNVIVAGGGLVGCETALLLAESGKTVRIIVLEKVAREVEVETKLAIFEGFDKYEVQISAGLRLDEIHDGYVTTVDKRGSKYQFKADTVVLAYGFVANNDLLEKLEETDVEVYPVGDCVKPRKIYDAIHEGFLAGFRL